MAAFLATPRAAPTPQGEHSHLPDDSLAALHDLAITLEGRRLPLHSSVLATQSAVLRSVFLSTDRGGWAAAVEAALAGASLRHATLCLRLAYAPHPLEALAALGVPEPEWAAALEGALRLADKLDMPLVMKLAEPHVMPKTPHYNTLGSHVLLRSDVDVARWLVLATQTGLRTLEERCVRRLLGSLLRGEPLLHATRGELAPQAGGLLAALAVMEGPFRQMRAHVRNTVDEAAASIERAMP